VVDPLLLDDADDFGEVLPEGGLAAGELDGVARHWALRPEGADHGPDHLEGGLVDIGALQPLLDVEEAVPAGEVAAVGDDDVGEAGVVHVVGAEAAVGGAGAELHVHVGCVGPLPLGPVGGEAPVHLVVAEVEVLGLTVLGADLEVVDLVVLLVYVGGQDAVALGADGLGPAYEV